jgi:hypothetical protein
MPVMGAHHAITETHAQVDTAVMSPLEPGHGMGGMGGMGMLCIAVLIGATLARILIRSRRGSRLPLCERVMTLVRVARRTDARQNGPPLVWAFSVIRC